MKKTLSLILALALCLGLAAPALAAEAASGKCGDDVTWSYSDGVLTIEGTGSTKGYYNIRVHSMSARPWKNYYDQIHTVIIGSGVTALGEGVFSGCENLTGVSIPDSVVTIGFRAFASCKSLTGVSIPDSVTSIEEGAFSGCAGLTGVSIPGSVASIGDSAFSGCAGLTAVSISNGVASIGEGAFSGCAGLTAVDIPASVTSIGAGAFSGCAGLTAVNVADGNPAYVSVDGVLFSADQTLLHTYPMGKSAPTYQVPASVTAIGGSAFSDCANLTGVSIPNSVTSIGARAFNRCVNLAGVTIPPGVTSIEDHAFAFCASLTSVVIPDGVTVIDSCAFAECYRLASVSIPNSVVSIGGSAFFYNISLTSVIIPEGVAAIGSCAFEYDPLTSVTIPASVATIGTGAFGSCYQLTDVYYGGSESQWKQIEFTPGGYSNHPLLDANIHYNSPVPAPSAPGPAPTAPGGVSVTVNGKAVTWPDAGPFIDQSDRAMVPLRPLADALGLTVNWNGEAREAMFTNGVKTIVFPIGSNYPRTSDGSAIEMDTAAVIVNDRTYAPARYLAAYFGYTVGWDGAARTVVITG